MLKSWENDGSLEFKIIDGIKFYFNRGHTNLFRINKAAKERKDAVTGKTKDDLDRELDEYNNHKKNCKCYLSNDCPVCLEDLCEQELECCHNYVHQTCLAKWYQTNRNNKCPFCRHELTIDIGDDLEPKVVADIPVPRDDYSLDKSYVSKHGNNYSSVFGRSPFPPTPDSINVIEILGEDNMFQDVDHGFLIRQLGDGTCELLGVRDLGSNTTRLLTRDELLLAQRMGLTIPADDLVIPTPNTFRNRPSRIILPAPRQSRITGSVHGATSNSQYTTPDIETYEPFSEDEMNIGNGTPSLSSIGLEGRNPESSTAGSAPPVNEAMRYGREMEDQVVSSHRHREFERDGDSYWN